MVSTAPKQPIKFYMMWDCPYAQRTWIALNHLNINYVPIQAFTIDEEQKIIKDEELLKINPQGKVPTLDVDGDIVTESIEIISYLHHISNNVEVDPDFATSELMVDAKLVNQNICSLIYKVFLKSEKSEQDDGWNEFVCGLERFTGNVQEEGYFKSSSMNIVDITFFPWANMLKL